VTTSDPIADMLTRIRNAMSMRHAKVDIPASKLKADIARILKEEGYILNFKIADEGSKKTMKIYLKYTPALSRVCRFGRNPESFGRPWYQYTHHTEGRHDW
jgi:small subunit ribosomal protein S8